MVAVIWIAHEIRQAWLVAQLSPTERKIVGAWSWTYHAGIGRIVFFPDKQT